MGCLKFIIRVIIIVLAIIGFKSLGGWDWIVSNWHFFERPTQEKLIEKLEKEIKSLKKKKKEV